MKDALIFALSAGIRTAAQTAAGLLGAVSFLDIGEFPTLANTLTVIIVGSLLSGAAAFLMNFSEQIQVGE